MRARSGLPSLVVLGVKQKKVEVFLLQRIVPFTEVAGSYSGVSDSPVMISNLTGFTYRRH